MKKSDTTLRVGIARTEITPALGTQLCGYPLKERPATSIHDPLNSTAIVFEQNGVKAVLISLDWIMIEAEEVSKIRKEIQARTQIDPLHITICATQTHCGPNTMQAWGWGEKDLSYIDFALPKIIDSAVKADASLMPARVGIATTQSDVGINRREIREDHQVQLGFNPWGAYDPEMTVLRFSGESGPIATIIHYGAHPTSLGSIQAISRDWPGVMIDRLEKITEAPVLFINGAVGDVAPRTNIHGAVGDGFPAAIEVGSRAASHALQAYRSIKEFRTLDLNVLATEIQLPLAPLPPLAEAEQALAKAEPYQDEWGAGMANFRYWKAVIAAHSQPIQKAKNFQQVIIQLGPIAIVPFPGEPFAEIVLRLRQGSLFQYTLAASTTNGKEGYFVTKESRPRGGYEVWVARAYGAYLFADHIDDFLVEENLKLLRTVGGFGQKSLEHRKQHSLSTRPNRR